MRYFLDTEFDGHGGALLSVGLVAEDGYGIHLRTTERAQDPWVIQNVEPLMRSHDADRAIEDVPVNMVGHFLRSFLGDDPHPAIVADSPVDIGRFCAALSTGEDGGWASADYPRMTFEVHNVDCYPTKLTGAVQHNAWWDAMALREKLLSSAEPVEREGSRDALPPPPSKAMREER